MEVSSLDSPGAKLLALLAAAAITAGCPIALTIRPDGSAVFTIRFTPDAAGEPRNALIYVRSDDPDGKPFEFTVSST